jgi:hypothetical protein
MLCRFLPFAGLLLVSGCAYDAGYHESNYASEPASTAGYYSPVDYTTPYLPRSPVYQSPYVGGPVIGGIYVYGDDRDTYGGPIFSPFHGIRCDRRRNICWDKNGPDARWTSRFFGHRDSHWGSGGWNHGNWNHGKPGGNKPNDNRPWVYQVPKDPDGSGTPTFLPNACGGNGQPPC